MASDLGVLNKCLFILAVGSLVRGPMREKFGVRENPRRSFPPSPSPIPIFIGELYNPVVPFAETEKSSGVCISDI